MTLLSYAFLTEPNPLQASAGATLTLVASNSGKEIVTVESVTVTLPVGTNAKDLIASADGIVTQPQSGWSVAQSGGAFTLTPNTPAAARVGANGLVFVFAGVRVIDQPGTTAVEIDESASLPSQLATTRSAAIPLAKFPAQFTLSELKPTPREVHSGGSTVVMWTGSPARYTLMYDPDGRGPVARTVGNAGPFTADDLTNPAGVMFTLAASVTVPGSDGPLVVYRQQYVGVVRPLPVVTLFTSVLHEAYTPRAWAELTWSAEFAIACAISGDSLLLNPSGALSAPSAMLPRRDTYTLIASNAVGATSAQLAVHWTPQLHSIPLADTPLNIAISPDGRRAYVCCSRSLTVLDIQTLQPVGPPVPLSMGWGSVTVSPDATRLYIAGVTNSTYSVTALDARTLVQGPTVTLGGSPMFPVNCAVSPDGTRVFVPLAAPGVAVVDTRTLAVAWLDVAELPSWVSISPDGRFAFISKFASNTVAVVDAVTLGIVSRSVPIGAPPPPGFNFGSIFNSVVSPDGTRAYILRSADATVWPIDVATLQPGAPSPALGPARDPMFGFGLAVTPDGLQLLASSANGLCVLQANPLGLTVTIPTGDSRPAGIAVSPDGSVALVALQSPNAIGVLRFVSGGVRPS